jgi:transposase
LHQGGRRNEGNGATVTVKVAHVRLCHSRMIFIRAYPRETQQMVFDAHDRAFAFFKGACQRGIYDNMKTKTIKRRSRPFLETRLRRLRLFSQGLDSGTRFLALETPQL